MYKFKQSYWSTLEPTPKQVTAIETYNKGYGVEIKVKNKQDAHDVIKTFVPKQVLEFDGNFVKGTNVTFKITNQRLFNKWASENKKFNKRVKSIKISDDGKTAYLGIKIPNITPSQMKQLNDGMFDMMENPSFSEEEDALGYLSPQELEEERNLYGVDSILTGLL